MSATTTDVCYPVFKIHWHYQICIKLNFVLGQPAGFYLKFIRRLIYCCQLLFQDADFVSQLFLHSLRFIDQSLFFLFPLQQSRVLLLQFFTLLLAGIKVDFQLLTLLLSQCQCVCQLLCFFFDFLQLLLRSVRSSKYLL